MSTFKVPITTIKSINPHFNAERLEIAQVYDFNVVVGKDRYKAGDKIILIPIDSILPENLEKKLFPEGSKITLHNSRVKQIKIRGYPSQGMIIDIKDIEDLYNISLKKVDLEADIAELIGVKKYEPPAPKFSVQHPQTRKQGLDHPQFHEYGGVENIKWYPDLFQEGEPVVIQEKLHGTNCRAAMLPTLANTFWKKLKKFLRILPAYERYYGSNRVQISTKTDYKGYYGEDLYGATLKKHGVFEKIKPGEIVYGEIIGPGIQKNYTYGLPAGEHQFVLFDVKILQEDGTMKWLNPLEVYEYAISRGFACVPYLYNGPYNKQMCYDMTKGDSVYAPEQKVREGVVVKSADNYNDPKMPSHKRVLKFISEDYLSKEQTDFN